MKIRVLDRILVFFAGIVLLFTGAGVIAERFFDVPVFDTLADMLFESLTVVIVAAAVLVLLGVYCVCMMFRRYKGKRGFVVQRTEGGELSISIKAIENLVQKCIDKHEELHVMSTGLENSRDGLVIKLRIGLASGVSIPLVVSALQKQIKQYVTACSGVDVREVKVQVETASANLKASPFAVPDLLATPVTEKLATTTQEPASVNSPVTLVPPEANLWPGGAAHECACSAQGNGRGNNGGVRETLCPGAGSGNGNFRRACAGEPRRPGYTRSGGNRRPACGRGFGGT